MVAPLILPGPYRLTYADWLKLPDDGHLYEIHQGELIMVPPPSIQHQRISREIHHRLLRHLELSGAGEIFYAPVGVKLSDDEVLEPDLVLVLVEHAHWIGQQVIEGPPDLVVEILSPGSAQRDLGRKRLAYQAAGVTEYWIVDPESLSVEVLCLQGGNYARAGLYRPGELLRSPTLPGLQILVAEVFPGARCP